MKLDISGLNGEEFELETELSYFQFLQHSKVNLDLAGIFFETAMQHFDQGKKYDQILKKEINKYKSSYKRLSKRFPVESEEFLTRQQSKLRELELFYEPVVRHFSTLKILLVCCTETYVNELALMKIKGKDKKDFERLPIFKKWIYIQKILDLDKIFNEDKEPLVGFGTLITERNKLVHFKGLKKDIEKLDVPEFIYELKLTTRDCLRNINSVKNLLEKFNKKWKGAYAPDWVYHNSEEYRNPCFYLGNRLTSSVLWSDKIDNK